MQSSLTDLSAPGSVTTFAMRDALRDIDRLLSHAGLPCEAVLSGIRGILAERLPPMHSPEDWPPARLMTGSAPGDAAGMIGGILAWNPGPATAMLSALARHPVTIDAGPFARRGLTGAEAPVLAAEPGTPALEREGVMSAGDLPAARTRLLLLPSRLPADALDLIGDGHPAGEVLAPFGMRRGRRRVCVSRAEATVQASAVLSLGDLPVGAAEENITAELCAHVAALAG